jgi:4-amino-4-deoxy-L-arabinose transferase-like glycosyltransferase
MNKKTIIIFSVLLFILAFSFFNNIYFLHQDKMPLLWDSYNSYQVSKYNYQELIGGNMLTFYENYVIFDKSNLVFFPSFILYPFFGISEDVASFQGTIFLIILIIATYLLGKELFNKDIALLAAILTSFSPLILAISKVPYDDIAFSAIFTLTLYFFLKSKKFSDIKYTWFFNISLGLTLLSRFNSFLILFFIILTYIILKVLFNKKDFRNYFSKWKKRNVVHFLISLLISMIVPFIFFFGNILDSFRLVFHTFNMSGVDIFNLQNILIGFLGYLKTLNLNFEYFFIFIIFVISLSLFFIFQKNKKLFILAMFVGANFYHFSMFYFFPVPFSRVPIYMVFIKPVYIIIISLFLIDYLFIFSRKIFGRFGLILKKQRYFFFLISIFISLLLSSILFSNYVCKNDAYQTLPLSFGKYSPSKDSYQIEDTINQMLTNDENYSILILCNSRNFVSRFKSYLFFNHKNVKIVDLLYISHYLNSGIKPEYNNETYILKNGSTKIDNIVKFDYIILCFFINNTYSASYQGFSEFSSLSTFLYKNLENETNYVIFKELESKDSDNIYIYKKIKTTN